MSDDDDAVSRVNRALREVDGSSNDSGMECQKTGCRNRGRMHELRSVDISEKEAAVLVCEDCFEEIRGGGVESMTDEEREELASEFAEPDVRYVLYCPECHDGWRYHRDSKVVKATRRGKATCPNCGKAIVLVRDNQP